MEEGTSSRSGHADNLGSRRCARRFADRAQRVTADAKPGWGKMNASAMMAHINDSLRMALGDLPVKSKNLPLRYKPIRKLFIYYLPMPKGAPTAPELIARCRTRVLEDEKKAFAELMTRCAAVSRARRSASIRRSATCRTTSTAR